jgi:hypothetical protein
VLLTSNYLLRYTFSGKTTAHSVLYLLRFIMCGVIRYVVFYLARENIETDYQLRSTLSGGIRLQPTTCCAPLYVARLQLTLCFTLL